MLIDVRTPEEYAFIGHPEMAWNVPLAFVTYQRKNDKTEYGPKMNDNFVDEVKKLVELNHVLILMCRSGDRSAMAVNDLAAAGFKIAKGEPSPFPFLQNSNPFSGLTSMNRYNTQSPKYNV